MRSVTFFPPYKQRENLITNNTLVLLSQVYRTAPSLLEQLMVTLSGDDRIALGPRFNNQAKMGHSVPDAVISQAGFNIFIETKPHGNLTRKQVGNHLKSIAEDTEDASLLLLTIDPVDESAFGKEDYPVNLIAVTFGELVEGVKELTSDHRAELNAVLEEYESYLAEEGLLPKSNNVMLVNPVKSDAGFNCLEFNMGVGVYHDQQNRSKRMSPYLGLYSKKSIRAVGSVLCVVDAKVDRDGSVEIVNEHDCGWSFARKFQKSDQDRVAEAARKSPYDLYGEVERYWLTDGFVETNYIKESKGGIQGHMYFQLDHPDMPEKVKALFDGDMPSSKDIAQILRGQKWASPIN